MDSDDDALLKSQHINTMGQFWVRPAGVPAAGISPELIVLIGSISHFKSDSICGRQPQTRQS